MAQIFHWSDIYSLDIADLDEQHKNIVALINALNEGISRGQAKDVLSKILQDLIDDASNHFGYEGELMASHAYPEVEEHRAIHKQFTDQVLDIQKGYLDGKTTLGAEVPIFLKNWLSDHILRVDKKIVPYLKKT